MDVVSYQTRSFPKHLFPYFLIPFIVNFKLKLFRMVDTLVFELVSILIK